MRTLWKDQLRAEWGHVGHHTNSADRTIIILCNASSFFVSAAVHETGIGFCAKCLYTSGGIQTTAVLVLPVGSLGCKPLGFGKRSWGGFWCHFVVVMYRKLDTAVESPDVPIFRCFSVSFAANLSPPSRNLKSEMPRFKNSFSVRFSTATCETESPPSYHLTPQESPKAWLL